MHTRWEMTGYKMKILMEIDVRVKYAIMEVFVQVFFISSSPLGMFLNRHEASRTRIVKGGEVIWYSALRSFHVLGVLISSDMDYEMTTGIQMHKENGELTARKCGLPK